MCLIIYRFRFRMEWMAPFSLYKLTALNVAVNAWKQVNFNKMDSREFVTKESKLEKNTQNIIDKIPLQAIPNSVLKDLRSTVKAIGSWILSWILYHECFFQKTGHSAKDFVPRIKWTQDGTIDQLTTMEELINSDFLELKSQFQLACIYCQEALVRTLWEQLEDHEISDFLSMTQEELPILVSFWCHLLTGDLDKLSLIAAREDLWGLAQQQPDSYGFVMAVRTKNETAVRWFWKKIEPWLSREQREDILIAAVAFLAKQRHILSYTPPLDFSNQHCAQILLFLLAQMTEKQMKNLGVKLGSMGGTAELLKYFLDSPNQEYLGRLARLLGKSFGSEDYAKVLLKIIDKIENVHETYDYRNLFDDFWKHHSTLNTQLDHTHIAELLVRLINIDPKTTTDAKRDANNIEYVIRDVNKTEMQKLMQDRISLHKVCFAIVMRGLWELYEILLRNCLGQETADLNEQKSKVFALVGQTICKDLIVRQKNWNLVDEFFKRSNLSEGTTTELKQKLKMYEDSYYEKMRISRNRKRNAATNYKTMAKKQSR